MVTFNEQAWSLSNERRHKPTDVDQFMDAVRQIDEFFIHVARLPGR